APLGGAGAGPKQEQHELAELPQHFADRYGWEDQVAAVAGVYRSLSPDEQAEVCILGANYGRAGAVDFYGPRHGLPPAISGHNTYYLWGTRGCTGRVVIVLGYTQERLRSLFEAVEPAATSRCRYCMPYENELPIWVARRSRQPL